MQISMIFIFILILEITISHSLSSTKVYRYSNNGGDGPTQKADESIELAPPLPTDDLPRPPAECELRLLRNSFAQTVGRPPVTVPYSPPVSCPPPWSHVVLHLGGSVSGIQTHRIAAVWIGGAEILRTSTPEPFNSGTFWNVRKDITRYSYLLQQSDSFLSMMLENQISDGYTGAYHVNITILYYKQDKIVVKEKCWESGYGIQGVGGVVSYDHPADMVIPVAAEGKEGFWFRVEQETSLISRKVVVPTNARRIVLELYASFHGDDEFWYSNPPNRYILANNLTTGQGNGPFREVYVRVDGYFVASEVPFPIVFPGGINPLFWKPVVGIGAFNIPAYDFDLTPFLGLFADGKPHKVELGVAHANQYWLLDANLHVWLEKGTSKVESKMNVYQPPTFLESTESNFQKLDGLFATEAQRSSLSSGWVSVSCGNLTTYIAKSIRYRNSIMYQNNAATKIVRQQVKVKTEVKVIADTGLMVARRKFKGANTLTLSIKTMPGQKNDTTMVITNMSVALKERTNDGMLFSSVQNVQKLGGWLVMKNETIVSGRAETQQVFNYRGDSGCFVRNVGATGGKLLTDISTSLCPSFFHNALHMVLNLLFGD